MNAPHVVAEPNILYFGTPVVLISTVNEDGTHNLAPMSSAFWLGWRGVLGIASASQTTRNLLRTGECVLNLPSINEVSAGGVRYCQGTARTRMSNSTRSCRCGSSRHWRRQ